MISWALPYSIHRIPSCAKCRLIRHRSLEVRFDGSSKKQKSPPLRRAFSAIGYSLKYIVTKAYIIQTTDVRITKCIAVIVVKEVGSTQLNKI